MDDLIAELKEAGTFTVAEMRWAEYLREEELKNRPDQPRGSEEDNFAFLDDDDFPINPKLTWRENYSLYLASPQWRRRRAIAIYLARNRCQRCKQDAVKGVGLEIHHKTYKHLGAEPMEELEALCRACHEIADREREEQHHVSHHRHSNVG